MSTGKWTYDIRAMAHTAGGQMVIIPDQAYLDQDQYDGQRIPVYYADVTGRIVDHTRRYARLDGEAYDLYGSGTGDPVVRMV